MKKVLILLAALGLSACATTGNSSVDARPAAPTFSVSGVTVTENKGPANIIITKSGNNKQSSTVTLMTEPGTALTPADFIAKTQTITFSAKQTTATVSIPITNDNVQEPVEKFSVHLMKGNNSNISLSNGMADVTIVDDDPPPQPTTQTCPDGTVIPVGQTCPAPPPPVTQTCPDGTVIPATSVCPTPPPPVTQTCPDGSVIPNGGVCPPPIPAGYIASPTLQGLAPIASEFDPMTAVGAAQVPGTAAPDVGAFRFLCSPSHFGYNDPLVFPGQKGKSHLHMFFGNTGADENSTYQNLRTSGKTTCGTTQNNAGNPGNRSAYWVPAMYDGKGNVVQPDVITVYYKRYPRDTLQCGAQGGFPTKFWVMSQDCLNLPFGLRFIFGRDLQHMNITPMTSDDYYYAPFDFLCIEDPHPWESLKQAAERCKAPNSHISYRIHAPECWDGKWLDTPNHRDHMAYASYGDWGYPRCPTTHPHQIPAISFFIQYTVKDGDDSTLWHLSSDEMFPGVVPGETAHADWFSAWDPTVMQMFEDACLDKQLNCSGGNLGNGYGLLGGDAARYWDDNGNVRYPPNENPVHLIPIPPRS